MRQEAQHLHEKGHVAGHGWKPAGRRVPTIGHEWDDRDSTYECGTALREFPVFYSRSLRTGRAERPFTTP